MLKWYQWYVIGRFCNLFCLLHCRNWKSMALMSVCNCVISVKKCFLSPNNGFLRFCQGKTQIPIKNYILNSTNRITTVLCQKCLTQQAHIIRASTLHPSSTILLLSYIFLCVNRRFGPSRFYNMHGTPFVTQWGPIDIVDWCHAHSMGYIADTHNFTIPTLNLHFSLK